MDSAVGEQIKKSLLGGEMKELVDPYLEFSFAGKEVSFKHNFTSLNYTDATMHVKSLGTLHLFADIFTSPSLLSVQC